MKNKNMIIKALAIVLASMLANPALAYASEINKDETVYVTLSCDGKVKQSIVSDWLHTDSKDGTISDKSILKDIVNIKGEEKPENKDGKLLWKTNSGDVFYRGITDKNLPFDIKISYTLNGNPVNADELSGKSGQVQIKLQIINKDEHTVNIRGNKRIIYTPFTTISVLNLPVKTFKNVNVNSGKIMSDGNNQVVTYISLPGLKESLNLSSDLESELNKIIDLPDELIVTADVTNFSMGPIMITAVPDLLKDTKEVENARSFDELIDGIEKLKDAGTKLSDGTSKIAEGQEKLSDSIGIFQSGVEQLNGAANDLSKGAQSLYSGVVKLNDAVNNGMTDEHGNKLPGLVAGSGQLKDGISQLNTAVNGKGGLKDGASGLKNGIDELINSTSASQQALKNAYVYLNKYIENHPEAMNDPNMVQYISVLKAIEESSENPENVQRIRMLHEGAAALSSGVDSLASSISTGLMPGVTSLDNGIKDLGTKVKNELLPGTALLSDGSSKINSALDNLSSGTKELSNGAKQLLDGSKELDINMKKFNDEGIRNMDSEISPKIKDIETLLDVKDELIKLSKNYGTFTGLDENADGKVKFIIKTDEIKVLETKVDEGKPQTNPDNGFFQWFKNILHIFYKR